MMDAQETGGFIDLIGPVDVLPGADGEGASGGDSLGFVVAPRHLDRAGQAHPGMLTAFADHVLATLARAAVAEAGGAGVAAVSLNCDFIGTVAVGETVTGTAQLTRRTRSLVFVAGTLRASGRPVLSANGIWKVLTP
jgi:acyl-coenzyme A thioesterase PaaI-like protein